MKYQRPSVKKFIKAWEDEEDPTESADWWKGDERKEEEKRESKSEDIENQIKKRDEHMQNILALGDPLDVDTNEAMQSYLNQTSIFEVPGEFYYKNLKWHHVSTWKKWEEKHYSKEEIEERKKELESLKKELIEAFKKKWTKHADRYNNFDDINELVGEFMMDIDNDLDQSEGKRGVEIPDPDDTRRSWVQSRIADLEDVGGASKAFDECIAEFTDWLKEKDLKSIMTPIPSSDELEQWFKASKLKIKKLANLIEKKGFKVEAENLRRMIWAKLPDLEKVVSIFMEKLLRLNPLDQMVSYQTVLDEFEKNIKWSEKQVQSTVEKMILEDVLEYLNQMNTDINKYVNFLKQRIIPIHQGKEDLFKIEGTIFQATDLLEKLIRLENHVKSKLSTI